MSTQETFDKAVEAMNKRDPSAYASLCSAAAICYDPFYTEPLRGRDAIRKDLEEFFTALPDFHMTVLSQITNGNKIATELHVRATHTGLMAGPEGEIPPTNKPVEFRVGWFASVDGQGLITEDSRYLDVAGLMQQLGL